MIASLYGRLEALSSEWAIINVGGIGFQVYMPTSALSTLSTVGEEVKLYTHLHLREDNVSLYGFSSPDELNLFYTLYDGTRRLPRARTAGFVPTQPPLPWDFLYQQDLEPFWNISFPQGAIRNWANIQDVEIVIRPNFPFTMKISEKEIF